MNNRSCTGFHSNGLERGVRWIAAAALFASTLPTACMAGPQGAITTPTALASDQSCATDAECPGGSCRFAECSPLPVDPPSSSTCFSDVECLGGSCQNGSCSNLPPSSFGSCMAGSCWP